MWQGVKTSNLRCSGRSGMTAWPGLAKFAIRQVATYVRASISINDTLVNLFVDQSDQLSIEQPLQEMRRRP